MRKRLSLVLALVMVLCLVQPAAVFADSPEKFLYEVEEVEAMPALSQGDYYNNLADAAAYVRKQMVDRNTSFTLGICSSESEISSLFSTLTDLFVADDGSLSPEAGDYLKLNTKSFGVDKGSTVYVQNGKYYYDLILNMSYYTTLSQEKQVTAEVKRIANSLKLQENTDAGRIKAVYDYVCSHVSYDNAYESDSSMAHTAYNALFKGKAVCQGYASLTYRLLREMGLSTRVITGTSHSQPHAWNIVKLDGRWYNLDTTWDSTNSPSGDYQKYQYFLKSAGDFADHARDKEFTTTEFNARYPMSPVNYGKWQPYISQVTGVKASGVTASYVKLTWNRQENAQGYRVYQYNPSKNTYSTVGTINKNTNTFTVKGLKAGVSYRFLVAAYHKDYGTGAYSNAFNVVTAPAKVNLTKLTTKSKSITAAWKRVTSGIGYQVQYSTSKSFTSKTTKSLNISKTTTVSKKISSLKKGTRYYVRVRAYKKDGSTKRYGAWSTAKNIVCK